MAEFVRRCREKFCDFEATNSRLSLVLQEANTHYLQTGHSKWERADTSDDGSPLSTGVLQAVPPRSET